MQMAESKDSCCVDVSTEFVGRVGAICESIDSVCGVSSSSGS